MNPDNLVKYQSAKFRSAKDPASKQKELARLKLVLELSHPETKSLTYASGSIQEDASEFLVPVLESLYERNPLSEKSTLTTLEKANQYKSKTPKIDKKYTIELPICGNQSNMSTLLQEFQREEVMSDGELPRYVKGKGVERKDENGDDRLKTKKKLSLSVAEDVKEIVVSTKRFQQDNYGTRTKIHNAVKLSNIEIPISGKEESTAKFEPTAFIVHSGEFGSGHYFSFIKERDRDGKEAWYEYNDSAKPREIKESEQCIPRNVVGESVAKAMGIDPNISMSLLELRKQQAYVVKYSSPDNRGIVDLPVRNQDERSGSINLGNTCWANSAAAFLSSFQSFQKYQNITLDDDEKKKLQEITGVLTTNVRDSKKSKSVSSEQETRSSIEKASKKFDQYKQDIVDGVVKPGKALSQALKESGALDVRNVSQKELLSLLIGVRKSDFQDEMIDSFDITRYNKKEISILQDLGLMPDNRSKENAKKFDKVLESKVFQDKIGRYKSLVEKGEVKPSDILVEILSDSESGYRYKVQEMTNDQFASVLCYLRLDQELDENTGSKRKGNWNKYEKEIFMDLGFESDIYQSSNVHQKKPIKSESRANIEVRKSTQSSSIDKQSFISPEDDILRIIKKSIKTENLPSVDESQTFQYVARKQERDVVIKNLEQYGSKVSAKTLEALDKESQNKDKIFHNKISNALRKLIDVDVKKNKGEAWKSLTTLDRRVLVDYYNKTSGEEIDFLSLFKKSDGNQRADITVKSQNYVIDDSKENMEKLDKILTHSLNSIPSGITKSCSAKQVFGNSISR